MDCKIVIDEVPPSLNVQLRTHWTKLKKIKDNWSLLIRVHSPNDWLRPERSDFYEVKITRYAPRLLDTDNLYGSYKFVVDALKSYSPPYHFSWGLIWDDDPEHAYFIYDQKKSKERKTVIEITRKEKNLCKENYGL